MPCTERREGAGRAVGGNAVSSGQGWPPISCSRISARAPRARGGRVSRTSISRWKFARRKCPLRWDPIRWIQTRTKQMSGQVSILFELEKRFFDVVVTRQDWVLPSLASSSVSDMSSEVSSLHSEDDDEQSHNWILGGDCTLTRRGTLTPADVTPLGLELDDITVATLPIRFEKEEEDLTPVPGKGPQHGFSFSTKMGAGQGTSTKPFLHPRSKPRLPL